ncbi:MAG: LLM class flavin-dependent oxidoreductase [Actinomycetota bacterium]
MRCALEVWGADFHQLVATCRRAEELDLDGFYYGESPTGLHLDCWTTLAALARSTERIRLGPVITNVLPGYRSTVLLAKQAATAAVVAAGRIDFRTGVGAATAPGRAWWQPFGIDYGPYPERAAGLDHTMGQLLELWAGRPVDLGGGEAVTLGFECPSIPVTIAAVGPTGMTLAATHARTWEASFCTPAEYRTLDQRFRALAPTSGGADPAADPITRSLEIDAVIGTTEARATEALATFRHDRADEDLDRLLGRALVGTPPAVAEQLAALAEAGVDQVVVAPHDPHAVDALEALAAARAMLAPTTVANRPHP